MRSRKLVLVLLAVLAYTSVLAGKQLVVTVGQPPPGQATQPPEGKVSKAPQGATQGTGTMRFRTRGT